MRAPAEGDPDRPASIYAAVISALIAGDYANFDPWPPVIYIDATARSSAGPVAVTDVVTSPIPIEVQHRVGEALAAHTQVRFVDDPRSVIQPDSRVRDHCVLVTLAPVPPADRPSHGSQERSCSRQRPRRNQSSARVEDAHHDSMGTHGAR
jgi:hypothetical protein